MIRVVVYSILYLFGLGDNPISVQSKSDFQSIRSDWEKVGKDISIAMHNYEREQAL